ncbi:MAG: hypothetical protein K5767_09010 [Clostridia bacterium]|nr:hypothetical protein [Clostridia bacterium]
MDRETADELMKLLRGKYRAVNQIYDLTKDFLKAFEEGDETNVGLVLDMRGKQIDMARDINSKIENLLKPLGEEGQDVLDYINGYEISEKPSENTKEIFLLAEKLYEELEKAKELDRVISARLEKLADQAHR